MGTAFAAVVLGYMIWSAFCGSPDNEDPDFGEDGGVSVGTPQDILWEIREMRACVDEALRLAQENENRLNQISESLEERCYVHGGFKPGTRLGASSGTARIMRIMRPTKASEVFRLSEIEAVEPIDRMVRRFASDKALRGIKLSSEEIHEIAIAYKELRERSAGDFHSVGSSTRRESGGSARRGAKLDGA